ncbi:hypothetical protein GGX14DRAFT_399931 [Mycena pura]|uniref:Uncharacterized protein n=1 Tax=Mycena pura TaxID=153505 RepID=A0AAD6V7A8_9AGAR|nr:hypothetical protein GGX14DRAFT_399931 [Mycena pura]
MGKRRRRRLIGKKLESAPAPAAQNPLEALASAALAELEAFGGDDRDLTEPEADEDVQVLQVQQEGQESDLNRSGDDEQSDIDDLGAQFSRLESSDFERGEEDDETVQFDGDTSQKFKIRIPARPSTP